MPQQTKAFSLVELSIVLVILGLLVGGILSGQSLIRAAELRSVTTQHQKYIAAVNTFKDKYFALPGDMTNAQSFWGVAHATPATCVTTVGTGTQTCNGDGNGVISNAAAGANEGYRFWQHLANAGLIEGSYTGTTSGMVNAWTSVAANSPAGKLGSSLWWVFNWGSLTGQAAMFDNDYTNLLAMGGTTANYLPVTPLFRPEELWNIDTKMDDGMPAMGKLVVIANSGLSTCTTTVANNGATLSASYLLTATSLACAPMFVRAF